MKTTVKIANIFFLTFLLYSCGGNKASKIEDFNKDIYSAAHSNGFNIKGAEGKESVIITTNAPWQGADGISTQLFISRNGEAVPDGFPGQVLNGDAHRIVAMSSTHIAMLNAIGEDGRVVGVSGIDYIINPHIQARRDSIGDIGYEGNINYELLLSLNPDLILLYGINGASSMEGKLKELGIPYMYVGDYLEESPLGKAEWMVALAEVAGKREEGVKRFAGIPQRYDALKKRVANIISHPMKVMVNAPYGDSWSMPSTQSYVAALIKDAGGELLYKKNTGNTSIPIGMEEAYRLASEADVWINVGTAKNLESLKEMCPKFTDTRCFTTGNIFNNNLRSNSIGGNDYFESAVVNPDIVLRDLVKIFHPELVSEDFVYYQQLKPAEKSSAPKTVK
ncbi:MAG: ABC transporter substrate-binding protein [Candidatus Amulumruptor caecigallinarius]|nr:ABC transporter substrate-binding protein [Candidatus Amulumruptor caecigallinarius]